MELYELAIALRIELGIPPTDRLFTELREEVRDLLEEQSSRQWEGTSPRFREPGLGKETAVIGLLQDN